MATNNILINTAQTLDIHSSPGQDLRFPTTLSDSIFTFGNFQLQKNIQSDTLETIQQKNGFSKFYSLESLSSTTFDSNKVIPNSNTTNIHELNQDKTNPQSYSYFGSFYSKVATSINNIIKEFSYAILSKSYNGIDNTIFDYSNDTHNNTSSFKIPISGLTNQGNIPFVSGASDNNSVLTVYDNTNQFAIQLSGATSEPILDIINYSYIQTGVTGYLNFKVKGLLFSGSTPSSASILPLYIRPTLQRFNQYKRTIPNLENQLLFDSVFLVPDTDDDSLFTSQTFVWPKSIDGFAPDGYGTNFETYSTEILNSCQRIDEVKTN